MFVTRCCCWHFTLFVNYFIRVVGEVVIASANNVLKYSARCEQNTGISGTLYVTNLRLTLHTTLPASQQVSIEINNKLMNWNY